jgi:hypothetical protein
VPNDDKNGPLAAETNAFDRVFSGAAPQLIATRFSDRDSICTRLDTGISASPDLGPRGALRANKIKVPTGGPWVSGAFALLQLMAQHDLDEFR